MAGGGVYLAGKTTREEEEIGCDWFERERVLNPK